MTDIDENGIPLPLEGNEHGKALYGLLTQLDESQWWEERKMRAAQLQQFRMLVDYAKTHSPFYAEHLGGIEANAIDLGSLQEIPLLARSQLQENNTQIDCTTVPDSHGAIKENMTSGSTALPVKFRTTALTATLWNALNMREHLWHERDITKVAASIRWHGDKIGYPPAGIEFGDWGLPVNLFQKTARSYFLNSSADIKEQISWLQKIQPSYLLTHPSNLRALLAQLRITGTTLQGLTEIRTIGESISDELRNEAAEQLKIRLIDVYSSEEFGYIALQCPLQNHYHVQSESVLLEVLRDDGSPCELNETGKIVITNLRNYATPLIRYEIGDYGMLGPPCSCGRGLQVLKSVHGRVRNMLRLPDGTEHWPNVGFKKFMQVAPIRQFQLQQHTLDDIEMRIVVDEKLSEEQEQDIREILQASLGHTFNVRISYHEALKRSPSGKFEDFVTLLSD